MMALKKGWQWPVAIVGFLTLTVIVDVTTLYIASTHPTLAAEPAYYGKALWGADDEALRRSEALGWDLSVVSFERTTDGRVELRVRVQDSDGSPVDGTVVEVEMFHVTRPKDVVREPLGELAPGEHVVRVHKVRRTGPWKASFRCRRGEDTYFHEERLHFSTR